MTLKPLLVTVIPALFITLSLFSHSSKAAVTWQQINENVQFLKQQDKLRFYDSNQVLIEGEQCALMVDASGNFAAVEALAKQLKKHLKTPLCYLIATHFHDDHLLGMAVLQNAFPKVQLIVHKQVADNFAAYQQAYDDKLAGYEKSIELSYQRLATLPEQQQTQWREKLSLAKQRFLRWKKYHLKSPSTVISEQQSIDLGSFSVQITPEKAHTNGDLTLSTNNGTLLIGGDIVDWLPYPGHGQLQNWQALLKRYINQPNLRTILPGHGGALEKAQLKQPLLFLTNLITHVKNNKKQTLEQLTESFPADVLAPYKQEALNTKSSQLFLQAGLKRAQLIEHAQ